MCVSSLPGGGPGAAATGRPGNNHCRRQGLTNERRKVKHLSTLILSVPAFTLKSTWLALGGANQTPRLTEPSLAVRNVAYGLSALPRGALIQSAELRVACELSGQGTFLIQGSPDLVQDLRLLIYPDMYGYYTDLTVPFSFRASIGVSGEGYHRVTAEVSSAVLTVEYTLSDIVYPEEAADAGPFRSAARSLLPRGILQFPDGSRMVIGAESILSFRIDQGIDDGPLLGRACAAMLSVRLANAAREWYPGGALRGEKPLLGSWLSLYLTGGTFSVPLGAFRLEEMTGEEEGLYLELRGFDAMAALLERPWQQVGLPASLKELTDRAAALSGLSAAGTLPCNGTVSSAVQPVPAEGGTIRKALASLCGAGGAFSMIGPDGTLEIRPVWPENETALAVGPEQILRLSHDESAFSFRHLAVQPADTAAAESRRLYSLDGSEPNGENTLLISGNPLFPDNSPQLSALAEPLKAALTGANWQALRMTWRWEPAACLGTPLTVTTAGGETIRTVLCGQSIIWEGGLRAEAYCGIPTDLF